MTVTEHYLNFDILPGPITEELSLFCNSYDLLKGFLGTLAAWSPFLSGDEERLLGGRGGRPKQQVSCIGAFQSNIEKVG